ncbi:MAG: AAA family ATPase [bacterium]
MKTIKRLILKPKKSFFLFGPRGTGKTTWLQETYPDAYMLDLLKYDKHVELLAHPERLRDIVEGNLDRQVFIIDEVQKNPALLDMVHLLIEKHPKIAFVLTGSSSRKLKRTGVDLLSGRAVRSMCHPFIAAELGDRFHLEEGLRHGLIPLVVSSSEDKQQVLRAYINLYIREEVQGEGLVRNLNSFTRFLEAVTFSHGSVLTTTAVARECSVNRMTVEGYLSILEDLNLGARMPIFSRRAKRGLITHDKFYLFDAGVFQMLRPKGPMDTPEEISGAALEGLVFHHLRAWNDYSGEPCRLHFWRTQSGVEVDFVLYGEKTFVGLEVKNSSRIRSEDLSGLKAFGEDYPEAKRIFLYRGKERRLVDGILCMPCETFLKQLVPGVFPEG